MNCPHCEARAVIRQSRAVTKTYREVYYACTDFECGHTFKAELTILCTLSPSGKPNPKVALPMGERRAPRPANDDAPLEAMRV